MALGETSPLQGPEQLFDIGTGETFAPRNLGAGKRLPGGHRSQLQDAAKTVFFLGCNLHRGGSNYSHGPKTILFCQVLRRTTARVGVALHIMWRTFVLIIWRIVSFLKLYGVNLLTLFGV